MAIYCITWTILCGKHLNVLCVTEPVVSAVNFICSSGFNYCWFHEFLSEMDAVYPHLSSSLIELVVLLRVFECRAMVKFFSDWEELLSATIIDHWRRAVEISFCWRLGNAS